MVRRNEDNGRKVRREIAILISVMCIAAFACGIASEPPRQPQNPQPPSSQNQPQEPNEPEPPNEPDEPEPQDEPPRPIDPDDLIAHGDGPDTPNSGRCGGRSPAIGICSYGGNSKSDPLPLSGASQVALGEWVVVGGCNFPEGESISVSITPPNGSGMTKTKDVPVWNAAWWITPDKPLGSYTVEVRSPSVSLEKTFQVVALTEPLLTAGFKPNQQEGAYVVAGFQPNEQILVARYELGQSLGPATLANHEFINLGPEGYAMLPFPAENAIVVAIGQEASQNYSGMPVSAYDYFAPGSMSADGRFVCRPATPPFEDLEPAPGADEMAPPG